jgi:hypothetical protein
MMMSGGREKEEHCQKRTREIKEDLPKPKEADLKIC